MALGLVVATAALAEPVGGDVDPINDLSSVIHVTNLDIVAASGLSDAVIVSGTINNNNESGWDLTVTSGNLGRLVKGTGGAGREITYANIEFVSTGGTLGTGLANPNGTKNITTGEGTPGTIHFLGNGTATSATVNYTFQLRISAAANTSLLSGNYTDNVTLTLNNNS